MGAGVADYWSFHICSGVVLLVSRTGDFLHRGVCYVTPRNLCNLLKIEVLLRFEFLSRTWNNGMMEYWKVEDPVFSRIDLQRNCIIHKYC